MRFLWYLCCILEDTYLDILQDFPIVFWVAVQQIDSALELRNCRVSDQQPLIFVLERKVQSILLEYSLFLLHLEGGKLHFCKCWFGQSTYSVRWAPREFCTALATSKFETILCLLLFFFHLPSMFKHVLQHYLYCLGLYLLDPLLLFRVENNDSFDDILQVLCDPKFQRILAYSLWNRYHIHVNCIEVVWKTVAFFLSLVRTCLFCYKDSFAFTQRYSFSFSFYFPHGSSNSVFTIYSYGVQNGCSLSKSTNAGRSSIVVVGWFFRGIFLHNLLRSRQKYLFNVHNNLISLFEQVYRDCNLTQ